MIRTALALALLCAPASAAVLKPGDRAEILTGSFRGESVVVLEPCARNRSGVPGHRVKIEASGAQWNIWWPPADGCDSKARLKPLLPRPVPQPAPRPPAQCLQIQSIERTIASLRGRLVLLREACR